VDKFRTGILFALSLAVIIVTVDVLWFRHRIVARLVVNVVIAGIFVLIYLAVTKRH
jgi:hypothetical protein